MRDSLRRIAYRHPPYNLLRRDNANLHGDMAEQHARYDRLAERVERIERRLDLADG